MRKGIYIVTLNNSEEISVNANDKRLAEKSIKVTSKNLKVGKAVDFDRREANYYKTFGKENVNFMRFLETEDIDFVEKLILKALETYRIIGPTGKKNEWLERIGEYELKELLIHTLKEKKVAFKLI